MKNPNAWKNTVIRINPVVLVYIKVRPVSEQNQCNDEL